ncbi:hypothetical protein MTO98_17695 [Mucilaginibacter sp. SMC90]|uniref:hypothetical protein n=1 Tax=Mucilaginibacter sp. SMC90 TaxID=2929803 RepID=UPI001FB27236|nr:hypothetical protein [Mucilaginibacter sp. SMC90]UOE46236.1 hypothetical protein MTO98_17695 [Mucilaginibacter sp. SMC90]
MINFLFKKITPVLLPGIILLATSCSTIGKYDQYAYTQTTSIKVDALNIMNLATDKYDNHLNDVNNVQSSITKMIEYKKNLPKNTISEKMWVLINDPNGGLFGGFVQRWQKNGTLDTTFIKEAQKLVGQSFDELSQLESGKIKPDQLNN